MDAQSPGVRKDWRSGASSQANKGLSKAAPIRATQ